MSTYKLYQEGQEIYQKFQIRLSTKETEMEHTKHIGMVSRAYIKLASTKNYNEILRNEIEIPDHLIEIQKQYVYERNMRSKMMVVYAIEKEANQIDLQLTTINTPICQYLSFKYSSAEERIAAIHANEMINIKARYKTLYDVNLETEVMYKYKTIKLG